MQLAYTYSYVAVIANMQNIYIVSIPVCINIVVTPRVIYTYVVINPSLARLNFKSM